MSRDILNQIFLCRAANKKLAHNKVLHFLEHTELIRYEAITIPEDGMINGGNPAFWKEVDQGGSRNRQFAETLLVELEETGVSNLAELKNLPQGYPSKILHTLAHILDGFIGADSAFYNLVEDSHWLSHTLREAIIKDPGEYWLVSMVPGRLTSSVFHPSTPHPER